MYTCKIKLVQKFYSLFQIDENEVYTGLCFHYSFHTEFSGCFQNSRNYGNTMNFIPFTKLQSTRDLGRFIYKK